MASTDTTAFPVKNQAYRLTGVIVNATTGNPITGGLTTLAATRSLDGAAFASTGLTVAEIGTTGYFTVDFTAAAMNADTITVQVTAANASAVYFKRVITPVNLTEFTGNWFTQTVKRVEHIWMLTCGYLLQKVKRNKSSGLITMYQQDETTVIGTMAHADDGTDVTKGELS